MKPRKLASVSSWRLVGNFTHPAFPQVVSQYCSLSTYCLANSINLNCTLLTDCDGYYRKGKDSLLYKYANGAVSKDVHKSTSSDSSSSTCDSCSHVLSLGGEENCRSSYYLNLDGSKCCSTFFHSSANLHCHEQLSFPNGKICQAGNCRQRQASICNANSACSCHCSGQRSSLFSANTISRLSTACKCLPLDCHHLASSLPSPSDTLKAYSPSTVSLAQCFTLASDRESLFSQSSQGSSSNSSSGCSSLTCQTDPNHSLNTQHLWAREETKQVEPTVATKILHERNIEKPELFGGGGCDGFIIKGRLLATSNGDGGGVSHCEVLSAGSKLVSERATNLTHRSGPICIHRLISLNGATSRSKWQIMTFLGICAW